MSTKQVFTSKKLRIFIFVILVFLYVLSILTCTIAFFTPFWLRSVKHEGFRIENGFFRFYQEICHSAGLVSGDCRFPYSDASDFTDYDSELATDMQRTFYCVLGTMCVLYTNLAFTLLVFIADLYENITIMSFLGVSFGVLYPLGALPILAASITLEVKYTSNLGFSTILGTLSGCLMLTFYLGLRLYDRQYHRYRPELLEKDWMNFDNEKFASSKKSL